MKRTKLYLYNDISGNKISVNQYHYGKGSKSLYIQGGIHGGELTYFVFSELNKWLKESEKKLKKVVTLVPIVNPVAWNQRVYYYTVGKFDLYKGKDWNRSYPGAETTLSSRNSIKIFNFMKSYEFCLDLHTARVSIPYLIFVDKKLTPFVKYFGLENNYFLDKNNVNNASYKGTFNNALYDIGIPSLTCECGSHDSFEKDNIDEVVVGIKNLVYGLGIMENNKKILKKKQIQINKVSVIFSPESGFLIYHAKPRQFFHRGQLLCTIISASNLSKKIEIKAKESGMMFELAKSNICWLGDELIRVVYSKNLEVIS